MVASRYPNQPQPLWNLPGGRQLPGELLEATVVREVFEETGLRVRARELAYVTESYDGETHFVNVAFELAFVDVPTRLRTSPLDHVVAVEWVPLEQVRERIAVAVVREPLLEYLAGALTRRYAGYSDAGITIEWPHDSH